jgi:hypothetical protein
MKKQLSRTILMITGITTVIVILLSQSFFHPAPVKTSLAKPKSEQKANHSGATVIVNAPSDVVPSSTMQLDENAPAQLKSLPSHQRPRKVFFSDIRIFTSFLQTLFRTLISPNAP